MGCHQGSCCVYNLVSLYGSKDFQNFLLCLFFLAANVGHDVVNHVKGGNTWVACTASGLQSGNNHPLYRIASLLQGKNGHHVGLEGAVRLYGHKALVPAVVLFLGSDNVSVVWVDFWNQHGHVGCPAVGTGIGNYRDSCLSIGCF